MISIKPALSLDYSLGTFLDVPGGMKHFFITYLAVVFIGACAGMFHNHLMLPASAAMGYDLSYNEQ